jgi:hypothetical protein
VAEAVIEPSVAVIVAVPTPAPFASPPAATFATDVNDELQLAALVRSCVLPSLYVPVAENCWLVPSGIEALAGVMETEISIGAVTVTLAEALTLPEAALILAVPNNVAATSPAALTGATEGWDDVHVAEAVRSCVLPSV